MQNLNIFYNVETACQEKVTIKGGGVQIYVENKVN